MCIRDRVAREREFRGVLRAFGPARDKLFARLAQRLELARKACSRPIEPGQRCPQQHRAMNGPRRIVGPHDHSGRHVVLQPLEHGQKLADGCAVAHEFPV